jgi:hypothetical protein
VRLRLNVRLRLKVRQKLSSRLDTRLMRLQLQDNRRLVMKPLLQASLIATTKRMWWRISSTLHPYTAPQPSACLMDPLLV